MRLYVVLFAAGDTRTSGLFATASGIARPRNPRGPCPLGGSLLLVEFLADKIPVFDSRWDSEQTFIRIPVGALLAAMANTNPHSASSQACSSA